MATKKIVKKKVTKKVAKKKAPAKRAYVRKKPVKKAATKRAYRKRKPVAEAAVPEAAPLVQEMSAEAQAPFTNMDILRQIEVLDMRELDIADRFTVLNMLHNEGYITTSAEDMINVMDNLVCGLSAEALVLIHKNKLVGLMSWETAKNSDAISRARVTTKSHIGFDFPQEDSPEMIMVDGYAYQRIG